MLLAVICKVDCGARRAKWRSWRGKLQARTPREGIRASGHFVLTASRYPTCRGFSDIAHSTKNGRLKSRPFLHYLSTMSVLRDNRSTPTVVHAHRDQIDVLRHAVGPHQSACSPNNRDKTGRVKPKGLVAHKQVIVFDAERPIRRKAKLKSGTDRSTPPAFGRSGAYGTADAGDSFVNIARYSGGALDVQEDVAPGIPDLSGE